MTTTATTAAAPEQNQIKGTLIQPEAIAVVQGLLEETPTICRIELARRTCADFGFRDLRGELQVSGCLKALREIAGKGAFELPPPQTTTGRPQPRRLGQPVPPAVNVPQQVDAIEDLQLVRVANSDQMRVWNELMIREHPDGHGPLVGRQMRYLIQSEHGCLGALGFAAAAWAVQSRDDWIGWDAETHMAHLDKSVSLARFLIRNDIRCHNLASRVLGMAIRQFPGHFEETYNYRPWLLETFVDTSRFLGTCYRAANWILVGKTKGRGRQDTHNEAAKTIKDIYVYPLVSNFRERMGLPAHAGRGPLPVEEGLDADDWAEQEFGAAPLGDERLSQRLIEIAKAKGKHPNASAPQMFQGDSAAIKAYYRFIGHPDEDKVTLSAMLQPHRECTIRRMQAQRRVLVIHDQTDLNFSGLADCEGLGVIGKNQTSTETKGLNLHSTFVVSAGTGLPLGLLRTDCAAPALKPEHKGKDGRFIPIEEKDTVRWIDSLRDSLEVAHGMPGTTVINVMDREGDFFELFHTWRENPRGHLLVRAKHDRRIGEGVKLFESVKQSPVRTRLTMNLCRRSARPKKGRSSALSARPARKAEVELRYERVEMLPPHCGLNRDLAPIPVWTIHVVETDPPKGQEAIEWFLLTTMKITSAQMAADCVRWYGFRWRIEDWHKVIQSGCCVEDAAHKTVGRLERVIAIHMVVAWRIHLMMLLAREAPDLPAHVLFTEIEVEVLHELSEALFPKKLDPGCVGPAVQLMAMLGGYQGRANDPPPGYEVLWRGLASFHLVCLGYSLALAKLCPD